MARSTSQEKRLYAALLALENPQEARRLLDDLCTRREVTEMALRLEIATQVAAGISYREIASETGASTATVTRVAQWLKHGSAGYKLVLDRLAEGDIE